MKMVGPGRLSVVVVTARLTSVSMRVVVVCTLLVETSVMTSVATSGMMVVWTVTVVVLMKVRDQYAFVDVWAARVV